MHSKAKQMAAALSAVGAYLQQEQEAMAAQGVAPAAAQRHSVAPANLWGLAGRQAMMQIRDLMHLKAFNRLR